MAAAITALLFTLAHANVLALLPLFLLGMLLARAYERSGNIWVPIGLHALFNLNNIVLLQVIPLG